MRVRLVPQVIIVVVIIVIIKIIVHSNNNSNSSSNHNNNNSSNNNSSSSINNCTSGSSVGWVKLALNTKSLNINHYHQPTIVYHELLYYLVCQVVLQIAIIEIIILLRKLTPIVLHNVQNTSYQLRSITIKVLCRCGSWC